MSSASVQRRTTAKKKVLLLSSLPRTGHTNVSVAAADLHLTPDTMNDPSVSCSQQRNILVVVWSMDGGCSLATGNAPSEQFIHSRRIIEETTKLRLLIMPRGQWGDVLLTNFVA